MFRYLIFLLLTMHLSPVEFVYEDPVNCGTITGNVGVDQDGDNLIDIDLEGVIIRLYLDSNQNGFLDGTEGDQIVNIDSDLDGNFDELGEVMTDVNGFYELIGVQPDYYIIVEEQPDEYMNQVEYDGGDDGDQTDNDIFNQIPSIVTVGEIDSGNDFVERRPLIELIIYSVPGTLNDQYSLTVSGSSSGPLVFPVNPILSGQPTGQDSAFVSETIDVQLTNADNNATLMNYAILFEVKGTFGNVISTGSTADGTIMLINNSKDAVFSFDMPLEDATIKVILVKQARLIFMKETVPANQVDDFTFNKLIGGGGIPTNFTLDGESIDGIDADTYVNQEEFQISGGDQGIYTIQEVVSDGWMINSISCFTIAGTLDEVIDLSTSSITIDVQNNDKCVCTFTNIQMGAVSGTVTDEGLGLPNVLLSIQDTSGAIINSVYSSDGTTDMDNDGLLDNVGYYYFGNLIPGNYNIIESQPAGFDDIMEKDGGDDLDKVDNNIINNIPAMVEPGEVDTGNDFEEASQALPVKISYFKVEERDCNRHIIWKLEESINLAETIIEYSFSGKRWNMLHNVLSQKNNERVNQFNSDQNSSVIYFRLKFVDFDGSINYSKIVKSVSKCYSNGIKIFPNPVQNTVNLIYSKTYEGVPSTIKIYDTTGKLVLQESNNSNAIEENRILDVSSLQPGVYNLIVNQGKESIHKSKIIKK
ncbi:MAG: T9SS type A sorting domain-containing protein [Saprospiraceae bacterium]|nr:T9SS type A sorting domain-containing protein [Saprospiraceae bacterium]